MDKLFSGSFGIKSHGLHQICDSVPQGMPCPSGLWDSGLKGFESQEVLAVYRMLFV